VKNKNEKKKNRVAETGDVANILLKSPDLPKWFSKTDEGRSLSVPINF